METPSNKFREGLKDRAVSERDMLERQQRVVYLELKHQADMKGYDLVHLLEVNKIDRLHLQGGIDRIKAFSNDIFILPDSKAREAVLVVTKNNIEQLQKKIENLPSRVEQCELSGAQKVTLSVFEEKFGDEVAVTPDITNRPPSGVDGTPEEPKDD